MGILMFVRLSDWPEVTQQQTQNVSQCKHLVYIPGGRKAEEERPLRIHYLLSQGTETQKPVLSLLQGSGELTVAKLQGQGSFFDLAQVTAT